MDTYLNRPVFPLPIEWATPIAESSNYDARVRSLPADDTTDPVEEFVARAFTVSGWCVDADELLTFETFLAAVRGEQGGWWFPHPGRELLLLNSDNATNIWITARDLAAAFPLWAGLNLRFTAPNGNVFYRGVTAVAAGGTGVELVTLSSALPSNPTSAWTVEMLLYVRLSQDAEFAFTADSVGRFHLQTAELPTETADPSTGPLPDLTKLKANLFVFSFVRDGSTFYQFLTDAPFNITVNYGYATRTFLPAPISYKLSAMSTEPAKDSATIELENWTGHPYADWFPRPFGPVITVEVLDVDILLATGAGSNLSSVFRGLSWNAKWKGNRVTVTINGEFFSGNRMVPAFLISARCNHILYDMGNCRVAAADYTITGSITAVDAAGLWADFSSADLNGLPDDYFLPGGRFIGGTGPTAEIRSVLNATRSTSTKMRLYFIAPVQHLAIGNAARCRAACDRSGTHCTTRFDNFINYGGHPQMPDINPMVQAYNLGAATGQKT